MRATGSMTLAAGLLALASACEEPRRATIEPAAPASASSPAPSVAVNTSPAPTVGATFARWDAEEGAAQGDARHGKELVARYECNRCHEGTGFAAAPVQESCLGCHQKIQAGTYAAPAEKIAAWKKNLVHYNTTPSLERLGERLRPSWVAAFLLEPKKTRTHVEEWMPRLAMGERDARDIAAYLTSGAAARGPARVDGDASRGKLVVESKGCMSCHSLTGGPALAGPVPASLSPEAFGEGMREAPDLRLARERFRPDVLVAWIRAPGTLKPETKMPDLGLTEEEARDAAAFLVSVPLAPPVAPPPVEPLPVEERRVAFQEVKARVFDKTCTHCHADPNMRGRGGPGSTGGLGFLPRGVQLSSWDGVRVGYIDREGGGGRRSFFGPSEPVVRVAGHETRSRLVAALLARHEEVKGRPVPGVRGMPLGLPPLPLADIQLVETWVAQGGPR